MKTIYPKLKKTLPILVVGALALAACTDNDYNFDEIDSTIGFGGGDLTVPGGSTDTILLDDVLDLEGTECVKIKDNGDYVFAQEGGDVEAVHPTVDKITITKNSSYGTTLEFNPISGAKSRKRLNANSGKVATVDGTIHTFEYSGSKPEEVKALNKATTTAEITLKINFSTKLTQLVNKLEELTIKLPGYMSLSNIKASSNYTLNGSELSFKDVPTSRPLEIRCNISELKFDNSDNTLGELKINGNTISLDGKINVKASLDLSTINISNDLSGLEISSDMSIDNFTITGATGKFSPAITLQDLGNVEVGSVPDFLTDGNVVIDLYNPCIILSIYNDMEIPGFVSGTITAMKNGNKTAEVDIPQMSIKPLNETHDGWTKICICRRANEINSGDYDEIVEVSDISNLIKTIPDHISFSAKAKADENKVAKIELGHYYNIKPQYSIEAPLTFDKDARIVYTDNIDGWNDDIKDLELADGSNITLTGTIENRIPAYLTLTAKAIDVNQGTISEDEIEVEVSNTVVASADGEKSEMTPITVKLTQKKKGAMKKLDGLFISFEADATSPDGTGSVTGMTLNAKKHFIIAHDIKIKLSGKIIGDFN